MHFNDPSNISLVLLQFMMRNLLSDYWLIVVNTAFISLVWCLLNISDTVKASTYEWSNSLEFRSLIKRIKPQRPSQDPSGRSPFSETHSHTILPISTLYWLSDKQKDNHLTDEYTRASTVRQVWTCSIISFYVRKYDKVFQPFMYRCSFFLGR